MTLEPLKDLDYARGSYATMFRFMYGHEYPDAIFKCKNPIGFHHDVYRLALYYEIPRLQDLALANFKKCAYYNFDEYYFLRILRKGRDVIDEKFHGFLVRRCHQKICNLCDNGYFHDVLRKDSELGIELAQSFGGSLWNYYCPKCGESWSLNTAVLHAPSYCPNCGHYEKDWSSFFR